MENLSTANDGERQELIGRHVRLKLKHPHRGEYGTVTERMMGIHLGTMYSVRLENCQHGISMCWAGRDEFRLQPRAIGDE